jgi:hypothetical protein
VESWKDLRIVAPSSGYLYIACQSEPKMAGNEERKVTISERYVLITEPSEQALYSIDQYADILKKYECLRRITFFRFFCQSKAFRKWKIASLASRASSKKANAERRLKKAYRDVYWHLTSLLEVVRRSKFVAASKKIELPLSDYSDYLFNSSFKILEEFHTELFPAIIEVILSPIKQAMLKAQYQEEEKRKLREEMRFEKEFMTSYLQLEN